MKGLLKWLLWIGTWVVGASSGMAQTLVPFHRAEPVRVLGFVIDVSTVQQVQAQALRREMPLVEVAEPLTGGTELRLQEGVQGQAHGDAELSSVVYLFDKNQKLAGVLMRIGQDRYVQAYEYLARQYHLAKNKEPQDSEASVRFQAPGVTIELAPPDADGEVRVLYLRDDFYQKVTGKLLKRSFRQLG
jgi:hypothetical protein